MTTLTTTAATAADTLAEHAAEIRRLHKRAIADVVEIGARLIECKQLCGHGKWLPWLEHEFGWKESTALNFMRVHELSKSANFADLSLPVSSVYLLAAPSTPEAARDAVLDLAANGEQLTHARVKEVIAETRARPEVSAPSGTVIALKTHLGEDVAYRSPKGRPTFNKTNEQISWAGWSWNPVTGCLHGCRYCYARELAYKPSYAAAYPVQFTPLFHHERLDAPANTQVPADAAVDSRLRRVFVCSMADLYGKWVPDEWIEQVHASCIANPQWEYLMLTKFPRRYVGLKLPPTAWLGTSVDEQKRVRFAEEAFRQIKGVRVKWLSLEPLLAPLEFSDLTAFDFIVIGAQSATEQPDGHVAEFAPPFEWVARLVAQAQEAGCRVYLKPNLLGIPNPQSPGMRLIQEEPAVFERERAAGTIGTAGDGIPIFLRRVP
jgi:protein gp37